MKDWGAGQLQQEDNRQLQETITSLREECSEFTRERARLSNNLCSLQVELPCQNII